MTRLLPLLAIMALFLGLVSVAHAQANSVSFDSATYTREVDENTGADQNVGSPVTASDTQSDALTYTLGGTDAASFEIVSTSGQIQTKAGVTYDHEAKSNYTVTVTASDGKGGAATATVTITINDLDEPPLAPDQPIAVAVPRTYREISVRWFPPENSGRPEITGYDVQYEDWDPEISGFVWVDGPQDVHGTSAIITNLFHSARYPVRVRAKNDEGDGPWSPGEASYTNFPPFEFELGDVRIPSGLGPGDSFRLLFVTGVDTREFLGFGANHDRITDYGAFLTSSADGSPYFPSLFFGTVLPLVSTPHVDARVATNTTWTESDRGVPIYWVGGSKVADDYADFYDGDWDDETNVRDSRGRLHTVPPVVWTGSAHDGTELMVNGVSHALGQPQAGYGTPGSNTPGAGPLQSGSTADSTVEQAFYGLTSVYRVVHPGLVSNLAQGGSTDDDRSARRSQRFTTGAHLHGYEISGIQVGYVNDPGRSIDFSISLHAVDTDGDPGAKVADFTYPDSDNERELTFETSDGITLDPGTTYAVVVTSGTTGTDIKLRATTSNREDSESEDGWSIEDAFDIESGSNWAADTDGRSLKIRIRGTPKVGPPAKPTGLSANAMGRDRINLSWTAPSMDGGSAITGYRIESSADGSTGWTDVVADTGTTTTSYSHTGLHANTTLYYRVSAINVEGTSDASDTANATDDDDPAVTVSFGAATYTAAEGGTATVTVTLSADPERTVEVPITATNQGGATSADYSGVPTSVTFDAGDTSKTFDFAATQDTVDDDGESVKLAFGTSLPAGVTAGATDETTVSIRDDDDPRVTVSFGAATYRAIEGSTAAVTVELSADPERTVAVPITKTNERGVSDSDYSGVPASITFNSGDTEKTITFTATADSLNESGERVKLSFGTLPAGVSKGTPAETTVTISDSTQAQTTLPTIHFGSASYTVSEGGSVDVTVTLSKAPGSEAVIPLTASNQGGATASDYSGVPTSVTFGAAETSKTFTVTAAQDTVDDDDESILLGFGTLPGGITATTGQAAATTVSITDDDDPQVTVSFGASTYTAAEGGTATVTVTLSADPERTVEVPITTTNQGGATSADYSGVPATVTFDAGETSQPITFAATQDTEDDDDESVLLAFGTSLPARVSAGTTAETTVSIRDDDDPAVTVSFGAATYTAAEGSTATVTVNLSADPERTVEVPITATNQGGATSADYSGVPATVTFNTGQISKTFDFAATSDNVDDDGESVRLGFGPLPARVSEVSPSETTVSIRDDDDPAVTVSFGASTYTAAEGSTATVTVNLSADPERTVEVPITTTNQGGATSADYSGVPATVTFNAGETSQPITFAATQDTEDDDGESVDLAFGALPTGVTAGATDETTVSIRDDDDPRVTVSFGAATYRAIEGSTAAVTVELSADPERTVEVPITATNQGGATSADYSGVPTSVTFNAGDTSKTFDFAATQDTVDDDGESVKLAFGALPTGVTAGATDETTVSIRDDDDPRVTVSFGAATYRAIEGSTAAVTVELSADPERTVAVPITKTNERGVSDSDYSGVPASITFNSGDTEKTITFTATADSLNESGERVKLSFGTLPAGVSKGTPAETTVTISDSTQAQTTLPTIHFGSASYTVSEGGSVDVTVTLSKAPGSEAVIPLTASNQGGATASDYSGVPTSVTFGAAETSKTFTVTAAQDTVDDDDESILLGFGTLPGGITATTGQAAATTVSITDDDDPQVTVSFGASTYTAAEGGTATVTVTLSADPERTVEVPITTTNQGGATSADYSGVPATVTFDAGETSQPITFAATQDTEDDDDESVLLAFGTSLPARVSAGTTAETTVSIRDDDDPAVTVSFGAATYTAAEGSTATVTVNLSADPERTVEVPITTTNQGGATSADYSGVPATVTFNTGQISKTFDFAATSDNVDDDGESVRLGFGPLPTGVSAGTTAATVLSITDDDDPGTDEDTPEAGNLRLVDGDLIDDKGQPCEGRLEIFYNGAWGTICDDYWTRADGNVACRALGFVAAVEDMDRYRTAYFPPGTQDQQIVLDDLLCKGNESGLLECPSNHPEPGIHNCLHSEDVGLRCLKAGEVAPWIIDVEFGDPPGGNGTYDAGETLDVTLVWSEAVTVTTPSGGLPPKVWLSLWADHGSDHTEMTTGVAEYASGSGTDRTVFRHTLQSGSFSLVGVDYNTLRVRDGSIVSVEGGLDAELDHSSYSSGQTQTQNQAEATTIIGVPAFNDPGADNAWGLGEPVEVTFTFSRPVQVDATGGNPSLPVLLSGTAERQALYLRGSGTRQLVFGYTLIDADGTHSSLLVEPNSLALNGGSIQDVDNMLDAAIEHLGAGAIYLQEVVDETAPDLRSAAVDGASLTLTYDEDLDTGVTPAAAAFAIDVNGSSRSIDAVSVSGMAVTLVLDTGVEARDTVTVDYTVPTNESANKLQDTSGNTAESFSGRVVSNDTTPAQPEESEEQADPLTASAHGMPASHDGSAAFTFELRFSEEMPLSYKTLRDHAFTVTGGEVVKARRLERGKNVRWEITVRPDGDGTVTIVLPATEDCASNHAICTGDGRPLSNRLQIAVPGPEG